MDIAILVLNAGIGEPGSTLRMSDNHIQDIMYINCLHVMFMTKIMIKQLSERLEKVG